MSVQEILEHFEVFPIDDLVRYGQRAHRVDVVEFVNNLNKASKPEITIKMALSLIDAYRAFTFGDNMERATMRVKRVLEEINDIKGLKALLNYYNRIPNSEKLKIIQEFAKRQSLAMTKMKPMFWELLKRRIEDRTTVLMPSYYDALIAFLNLLQTADVYNISEKMLNIISIYMAGLVCYISKKIDERTLTWLHADLISSVPGPLIPSRNTEEINEAADKLLNVVLNYFE